jgi:preprotein translocase subunit SecB
MQVGQQINLTILGVSFPRVIFTLISPTNFDTQPPVEINIKPKVFYPQDQPNNFHIIFELEMKSLNFFDLQVLCAGGFAISSDIDEPTRKDFISKNAPAIVFPYLRAFVTNFTSSLGGVIPTFVVPPQFFQGPIEEVTVEIAQPAANQPA